MKKTVIACVLTCSAFGLSASAWSADCPFPSPFGSDDRTGASQTQTPEKVLEAAMLIEEGRVYRLHHPVDVETVFLPFARLHSITQVIEFPAPPQVFNEAVIESSIGQIGSQFDALSHAGTADFGYYNCIPRDEVYPDDGGPNLVTALGIDTVKAFFTRAVLFDFVNHFETRIKNKGEPLPVSYVITVEDLEAVMKSQGVRKPRRGDVALIYTGMEAFYGGDNQEALLYSAGLGIEAVRWLASLRVAAVGADNLFLGAAAAGIEVDRFPPGHPMEGSLYPSHHVLLVENGIHILENLKLSDLANASLAEQAADEAMPNNSERSRRSRRSRHPYEYAFVFNPVPIVGLSGSPGNALAVD